MREDAQSCKTVKDRVCAGRYGLKQACLSIPAEVVIFKILRLRAVKKSHFVTLSTLRKAGGQESGRGALLRLFSPAGGKNPEYKWLKETCRRLRIDKTAKTVLFALFFTFAPFCSFMPVCSIQA